MKSYITPEKPKALVLITAIEPFAEAELINRTYDVDFSFKFKKECQFAKGASPSDDTVS